MLVKHSTYPKVLVYYTPKEGDEPQKVQFGTEQDYHAEVSEAVGRRLVKSADIEQVKNTK